MCSEKECEGTSQCSNNMAKLVCSHYERLENTTMTNEAQSFDAYISLSLQDYQNENML